MGIIFGMGFLIFLIFTIPAAMFFGGSITLFYLRYKRKKTVFLVTAIICLVLALIFLACGGIGVLFMYEPLEYIGILAIV